MAGFCRWLMLLLTIVAVSGCSGRANGNSAHGKGGRVYVLRYGSPYPATHPFSLADRKWIKYVEARSHGRLKIKPFWGGTLISNDYGVIELRHGVVDIALITPIYDPAGMQVLRAQTGFYEGANTFDEQVAVYKCLAREFRSFKQELAGVRVLAVQGGGLPNLLTKAQPVSTLTDMAGLRLRGPDEVVAVLNHFSADGITMPMSGVYSAMSKGIIDGVIAPPDTLKALHFSEVAHYLNELVVPRGAYPARAISQTAWNRLPAGLQKVLADSEVYWEEQLRNSIELAEKQGLAFGKAHGIVMVPFSERDQKRFNRVYDQIQLRRSAGLSSVGANGPAIFRRAQKIIHSDGKAGCPGFAATH